MAQKEVEINPLQRTSPLSKYTKTVLKSSRHIKQWKLIHFKEQADFKKFSALRLKNVEQDGMKGQLRVRADLLSVVDWSFHTYYVPAGMSNFSYHFLLAS